MLTVFNISPTLSVLDTLLRRRSNTDILYMRDMLPRIADHVPLAFCFNESVLEAIKVDSSRLLKRFRRARRARPDNGSSDTYPRYRMPTRVKADVVYAYGCGVMGATVPIVYHDVFAPFWLDADANGKVIRYKDGAIEQAAVITTWTEHSAAVFRERFPQHAGKIRVVPPQLPRLNQCFLPPQEKQATRAGAGEAVKFVFVGTEAKRKGLESVVAAWERLAPEVRQQARLTVCSAFADGEVRIPPDVEHRGYERDVPAVLKGSDVFVMPSRQESYGFVYAEAAAASCAIVATDDATRRSMLPAGGTSFVSPAAADQIAAAMRKCVEDRAYLRTAQEVQYAHALKTWSPRYVADLHYEAFQAAHAAGSRA
jgi:glycosyltransferase involved in cell wall biosynthesis